jgi:hypothetical protein
VPADLRGARHRPTRRLADHATTAGVQGPWNREWVVDDTTPAHAAYIARHAEWLAACDYADEASDELAGLASRAYGLAYPSGTRRVEVGPCPLCEGTLTAIVRATDGVLPSEVVCDRDEDPHRWAADQWRHDCALIAAPTSVPGDRKLFSVGIASGREGV